MSAQLALALEPGAVAPRPRALRVAPLAPLPRTLRVALATVYTESPDGRALAELAAFWRRHHGMFCIVPRHLRKHVRRLALKIGDGRR